MIIAITMCGYGLYMATFWTYFPGTIVKWFIVPPPPQHHVWYTRGVSKTFDKCYQKTNKTEYTNNLTLLAFKINAILHSTLLATFIKLLETVSKGLFRNLSQNRCHTFLDCRQVSETCAVHDALHAGKQKNVHPTYSPELAPAGAPRTTSLDSTCPSTIFYRLLLNWESLRRH
jgi:hypothetical protein